jgi:hypothetical protein
LASVFQGVQCGVGHVGVQTGGQRAERVDGGTVVAMARNEMPTESGVAAIFRYA